jgi:hypothetical protein
MTTKPKPSPKPQFERFLETARQLECDEDETVFDEKLRQIARHKPEKKMPKRAAASRADRNGKCNS